MVAVVLLLVAGVAHASAHKFLNAGDAGERLTADAAEEKLELGKFFDEVSSEAQGLQKALNAEKAKNEELEEKTKRAVSELHHAKSVFATELHKVETRVSTKMKDLTAKNQKLEQELSRDKLTLVLHEKTEDALRQSLGQISKVFQSQQAAVQNIISTTSDVDSKLKTQDAKAEAPKAEAEAPPAEELHAAVTDAAVDAGKAEELDAAVNDAAVDAVADDAPAEEAAPAADDAPAPEKPDSQATTVALTHHVSKAKPAKAAEDLDLDDAPKPTAAAAAEPTAAPAKKESDMDSIKAEVDALDKEVDSPDDAAAPVAAAATKADSNSMLAGAGDALNKLLKS